MSDERISKLAMVISDLTRLHIEATDERKPDAHAGAVLDAALDAVMPVICLHDALKPDSGKITIPIGSSIKGEITLEPTTSATT